MHKTLKRQLVRIYGSLEKVPPEHQPLIDIVSHTYEAYDADYKLIERSLEISSAELTESNERLRKENEIVNEKVETLGSLNDMMIDREIKMVELKKEIKRLRDFCDKNT